MDYNNNDDDPCPIMILYFQMPNVKLFFSKKQKKNKKNKTFYILLENILVHF